MVDAPVPVLAAPEFVEMAQAGAAGASKRERVVQLDVALLVNGGSAGDVAVETTVGGDAAVDFAQLVARLRPIVTQVLIDELTARAAGRVFVPVADLRRDGFPLIFDIAALQLRVDIPLDTRSINAISISGSSRLADTESAPPSDFSFGVSLTFADRLNAAGSFRDLDREPFNLAAQGFVNVGGRDGAYLTFLTGIREGGRPFRSRTTLFHDDVGSAVRYSLGDIDPLRAGSFASPVSMFGVGVERLYQTIQPYRNLRPAGRGALQLERPSRVEVIVNGAPFRTISLAPGRYDLRDFPFLDGLNDVRLVVQDDTGRNETIGLSFFSDTELLAPGLSIFSATAGFRRNRFSPFASTNYRGSPTFSGLYQIGLTDRLTLGTSLQSDKNNLLATGLAVVGTPIGLFGIEAAVDRNNREKLQGALLVSYRLTSPGLKGQLNRLDVDFQLQSARFSPMEEARLMRTRYRYDVSARYQASLPYEMFATVAAGYSRGRGAERDLKTANAGLSRSFGRVNLTANYAYRSNSSLSDHRGTFSLTLPFSSRQLARATYDTARNRVALDYNLLGYEGLNQTNVQATLARDDVGQAANLEVEHFANRFRAAVRHSYDRTAGLAVQHTDIALTTGIGYADGTWAIGREADRGFVIVRPHRTLKGADVTVSNRYTLGPSAKTGVFGPALVPLERAYQPDSLEVDIPKLPAGYDIGAGRFDVFPGAASGYVWTIGSAASHTILGRLLNADGTPARLIAGKLQPITGGEAREVPFFSNRTGRLTAAAVAPGRYAVIPAGSVRPIGEITVAEDSESIVNIGELRLRE